MNSNWIREIQYIQDDTTPYEEWKRWERTLEILKRVDELLRLAMSSIESDKDLYSRIWKEINGDW